MTQDERIMYNKAINTIDFKIIGRPNVIMEPTIEQLRAVQLAVHALEVQAHETERDFSRHIAVLNYHLSQPTAILFKDRITIDAMVAGIVAIKRLLGTNPNVSE